MTTLCDTALAAAVADTEAALAATAPGLAAAFREALPRATDLVTRRLLGALYRENLAGVRTEAHWRGDRLRLPVDAEYRPVHRHGFDRVEFAAPVDADPARLLADLSELAGDPLGVELADASVNLALAYARQERAAAVLRAQAERGNAPDSLTLATELRADDQAVFFERLATEGHNLHPCGRTRLGWDTADALAHDLEAGDTSVGFVAVRRDLHLGDDVGPLLGFERCAYAVQPVHAWQLDRVIRQRYADLMAVGALIPLDGVRLRAKPTAALRTVLLDPDATGARRYLKLSLDIQVTSTRRTISVASTRNGPLISALLHRLLADDPAAGRVLLLPEVAGAAVTTPRGTTRDLAAIVRGGLDGRLAAGEVAVPGGALGATSPVTGGTVLAELVDRYAATRRIVDRSAATLGFLAEYARLLLPPLLHLATRFGIGFEAHLQNCVPTFVDGVPHRLALRDFAGLRIHRPRLARRGVRLPLWPGSVIGTDDADVMRAKLGYTAMQAHLGELVVRLVAEYDVDELAAWSVVRAVLDETYDELRGDPTVAADAADDHAFLTAPTVPHKALVRMRLAGTGDVYVPVTNPLR
jgi:siderophore synthetase component